MSLRLGAVLAVVAFGVALGVAGLDGAVLAAIFAFFLGKLLGSTGRTLRPE